jgi:hypothetical protein
VTRVTADVEESFVVFLIGMRVSSLWRLHEWLPVAAAMPRMLRELEADPESGLLGHETTVGWRTVLMVQYWTDFESLHRYARSDDGEHRPAWAHYDRAGGESGAVGVFHETYLVDAGDTESVYRNVPPFGLGAATGVVTAEGERATAAGRLGIAGTATEESATDDGDD